jgi:hypothetical protein
MTDRAQCQKASPSLGTLAGSGARTIGAISTVGSGGSNGGGSGGGWCRWPADEEPPPSSTVGSGGGAGSTIDPNKFSINVSGSAVPPGSSVLPEAGTSRSSTSSSELAMSWRKTTGCLFGQFIWGHYFHSTRSNVLGGITIRRNLRAVNFFEKRCLKHNVRERPCTIFANRDLALLILLKLPDVHTSNQSLLTNLRSLRECFRRHRFRTEKTGRRLK